MLRMNLYHNTINLIQAQANARVRVLDDYRSDIELLDSVVCSLRSTGFDARPHVHADLLPFPKVSLNLSILCLTEQDKIEIIGHLQRAGFLLRVGEVGNYISFSDIHAKSKSGVTVYVWLHNSLSNFYRRAKETT